MPTPGIRQRQYLVGRLAPAAPRGRRGLPAGSAAAVASPSADGSRSAIVTAAGTPSCCESEDASTAPRRCVARVATCVSSARCSGESSGRHRTPRHGCADGSPIAARRSESSAARSRRSRVRRASSQQPSRARIPQGLRRSASAAPGSGRRSDRMAAHDVQYVGVRIQHIPRSPRRIDN